LEIVDFIPQILGSQVAAEEDSLDDLTQLEKCGSVAKNRVFYKIVENLHNKAI
jgi:hypothetical protein